MACANHGDDFMRRHIGVQLLFPAKNFPQVPCCVRLRGAASIASSRVDSKPAVTNTQTPQATPTTNAYYQCRSQLKMQK